MTLSEDVLRDLLLEHGIEGVTLWHIRALAELLRVRAVKNWRISRWSDDRWNSDVRGEDAALKDAVAINAEFDAHRRHMKLYGARNTSMRGHQIDRSIVDDTAEFQDWELGLNLR